MQKNRWYGAKNLGCRADFFVRVNGVLLPQQIDGYAGDQAKRLSFNSITPSLRAVRRKPKARGLWVRDWP